MMKTVLLNKLFLVEHSKMREDASISRKTLCKMKNDLLDELFLVEHSKMRKDASIS